jgi:glycine cleavage system H protein
MAKVYYTSEHEWISVEDGVGTVGITDHAQEQLGDLVFIELPDKGKVVKKGDGIVVIESVKAASDVYAPVGGEVIEANDDASADPSIVNSDAMGKGWLWKMKVSDESELDGLMDEASYKATIA